MILGGVVGGGPGGMLSLTILCTGGVRQNTQLPWPSAYAFLNHPLQLIRFVCQW